MPRRKRTVTLIDPIAEAELIAMEVGEDIAEKIAREENESHREPLIDDAEVEREVKLDIAIALQQNII